MLVLKNFKVTFTLLLILFSFRSFAQFENNNHDDFANAYQEARPNPWDYDFIPDTPEGKKLIDLYSNMPYFPAISEQIMRETFKYRNGRWSSYATQKFRPAFGPVPFRVPKRMKMLFIGQDATHAAEWAMSPGTAGFGGRAHSFASYWNVYYSAGFTNAYTYTIKGQYSSRGAPFVLDGKITNTASGYMDELGSYMKSVTPNDVWAVSMDQDSPLVKWRNKFYGELIEQHIENDLKVVFLFGQAAGDAMGSLLESSNAKVGSQFEDMMDRVQVPEFYTVAAGGNNEAPVLYNKDGGDLYQSLSKERLSYSGGASSKVHKILEENHDKALDNMVFSQAGPYKNGLLYHAQIGGYDMDKIYIDGSKKPTRNLKGFILPSGKKIEKDLFVIVLPHPTYLTNVKNGAFADHVFRTLRMKYSGPEYNKYGKAMETLDRISDKSKASKIRNEGFRAGDEKVDSLFQADLKHIRHLADPEHPFIEPDFEWDGTKKVSDFDNKKLFSYDREEIDPSYYDYGAPYNRMMNESTAKRGRHSQMTINSKRGKSRGAQIIVAGSRDLPKYDYAAMDEMLAHEPNQKLNPYDIFLTRTREIPERYQYDRGPTPPYDFLFKNLDRDKIYEAKPGKSWSKDGIDAFYIRTHPKEIGDYAHYRGSFKNPKVIILTDPDGFDGMLTSVAQSGTRGQYLQGLMNDMGVDENYLVVPTVPYGMDGASEGDWQHTIEATKKWREDIFKQLLKDYNLDVIIADGKYAQEELNRIIDPLMQSKVINIEKQGLANGSGIKEAAKSIREKIGGEYKSFFARGKMDNIPKSHFTYRARTWFGTSGDRVLPSLGYEEGIAFQAVVPNWVVDQKPFLDNFTQKQIDMTLKKMNDLGFAKPDEAIPEYLKRRPIAGKNPCSSLYGKGLDPAV